jgi:hypothetical protein
MKTSRSISITLVIGGLIAINGYASSLTSLNGLIQQKTEVALESFKKDCTKGNDLMFESNQDAAKALEAISKSGSVISLRGLIFAESHCTDGANREMVLGTLGNAVLVSHPANLIKALFIEKKWKDLSDLAEYESEEWFGVECENPKCAKERKNYFRKKREALKNAKISKDEEVVRFALLNGLKSDQ